MRKYESGSPGAATNFAAVELEGTLGRQRQKSIEQQLGAPVDYMESPPFMQRVGAAFRREPEQVLAYWQDQYGKDNVRLLPDGQIVVKTIDKAKGPKFIPVDEDRLTMKDLDSIAGVAPEIAGTIIALRAGGKYLPTKSGALRNTRDIVLGAVGAETAGALKDVGMSAYDNIPIEIGEIASDRLKMAGVDVGLGAGLLGGTKLLSKFITPFGRNLPPIQVDAKEAEAFWTARGVPPVPYTAGQRTGSPFLLRSEVELRKRPGGSGHFTDSDVQQQQVFEEMQGIIQGQPRMGPPSPVPTLEDLAKRTTEAARGKLEPVQEAVFGARQKLVTDANTEILNRISASTMPQRQLYTSRIGEAIRTKTEAKLADFQKQKQTLYDAAYALPGGRDRILIPEGLARKARVYITKELPSKEVVKELPTVDAYGGPTVMTVKGRSVMREFIPENVLGFLKELSTVGQTKFSLQDLVSMRNEVGNAIKVGEAVPGVQTHHLSKIYSMMTDAIHAGTEGIEDKGLRNAWKAANDFYANNIQQFNTPLVSKILKPIDAPGYVGDREIFTRIMSGSDKLSELRTFLGASSPEYAMLKRGVADRLYEDALYPGQQVLNAKSFLKKLSDLKSDNREVFDEVFGRNGDALLFQSQAMTIGQADKLDAALLEQGIAQNAFNSPAGLRALITAQRDLDKAYQNEIVSMIGSKSVPGPGFSVNDFVSRFVHASKPQPEQIRQFMGLIADDAGLTWQVKAKTVQSMFQEAAGSPSNYDTVAQQLDPNRAIAADRLMAMIKNPDKRKVYEAVLGGERLEMMEQYAKAARPVEYQDRAFATAGSMGASADVQRFWQGGIGGAVDKALHNWVGGFLLTAPVISKIAGNTYMTAERQHLWLTRLLSSEPVMKAMVNDFRDASRDGMLQLKQAMDGMVYAEQAQASATNRLTDQQVLERLRQMAAPKAP